MGTGGTSTLKPPEERPQNDISSDNFVTSFMIDQEQSLERT
jgi:hypothetical protein